MTEDTKPRVEVTDVHKAVASDCIGEWQSARNGFDPNPSHAVAAEVIARFEAEVRTAAEAASREEVERKDKALLWIAERAAKLRAGTDDWFELVEFEQFARAALSPTGKGEGDHG